MNFRKQKRLLPWVAGFSSIDFNALDPTDFSSGNLGDIINVVVSYIFPLAGLILLLFIIYGGYTMMLSGGDPKKMADARAKITNGVIGFIIIFVSYWIVQAIGVALGFGTVGDIFQ